MGTAGFSGPGARRDPVMPVVRHDPDLETANGRRAMAMGVWAQEKNGRLRAVYTARLEPNWC